MKLAFVGRPESAKHYASASARMPVASFTAVVARDGEDATLAATELPGRPVAARSLDEFLQAHADGCDAVVIHGNAEDAEQSALAAIARGKHVLVASPMASSSQAASKLVAASAEAGVVLMAGHSWRFRPSHREIKSALDAGSLGAPALVRIHAWRSIPQTTAELVLGDALSALDLATWLFGERPQHLYAVGHAGYLQIHCGFAAGGMAVIDCSGDAKGADYLAATLIGSTGAAYADDHRNRNLLFDGSSAHAIHTGEGSFAELAQLAEFVAAVEEGRPPAVTGEVARQAIELAEAAHQSLQTAAPLMRSGGGYERRQG